MLKLSRAVGSVSALFLLLLFCGVAFCDDAYLNKKLLAASSRGETLTVVNCLAKGAFVDTRDKLGNTPLIIASDNGYMEIVRVLLNKGAAVNAVNNFHYTALFSAVASSHKLVAASLMLAGADTEIKNSYGTTVNDFVKALGYASIEEYVSNNEVNSALTNPAGVRGELAKAHNAPWQETFNKLLSENKSKEAANFLISVADNGNRKAQILLGQLLLEKNNIPTGINYLKKASDGADSDELYEIGMLLLSGNPAYDAVYGEMCMEKASQGNNMLAKTAYAKLLFNKANYSNAMALFVNASDSVPEAEFYMGYMIFAGKGTVQDEKSGLAIIRSAAKKGYKGATDFMNELELEQFIAKVSSSSIDDRGILKSDLLSSGASAASGVPGCDAYALKDAFGGAFSIVSVDVCFLESGSIKATYHLGTTVDADKLAHLKNIAGNADFILP